VTQLEGKDLGLTSVVSQPDQPLPTSLSLFSPYPNPFNAVVNINYALPQAEDLTLKVYDTNGRLVATLVDGHRMAGYHTATWNAVGMPSGIYIARIESQGWTVTQKVTLIR